MHLNSRLLFEKHAKPLFRSGMRVLEIRPDGFPSSYQQLVANAMITWETLDLYSSDDLTYVATDEYTFPISDDTFDIVLSGQVLEHVRKIWTWTKELARVCKEGGVVITINPVSHPYHEAPVDCWRVYPEGMKALYEEAGLAMETSTFESLVPFHRGAINQLKLATKAILRREQSFTFPVADTIAIGRKQRPAPRGAYQRASA